MNNKHWNKFKNMLCFSLIFRECFVARCAHTPNIHVYISLKYNVISCAWSSICVVQSREKPVIYRFLCRKKYDFFTKIYGDFIEMFLSAPLFADHSTAHMQTKRRRRCSINVISVLLFGKKKRRKKKSIYIRGVYYTVGMATSDNRNNNEYTFIN